MEECKHLLDPKTCSECKPTRVRRFVNPDYYGRWIGAAYTGPCAGGCSRGIVSGEMIRPDGEGGWLCWECGNA